MATPISSFLGFLLLSTLVFLCSLKKLEGRETIESNQLYHSHTVKVISLLPSTICSPSTKGYHTALKSLSLSLSLSLLPLDFRIYYYYCDLLLQSLQLMSFIFQLLIEFMVNFIDTVTLKLSFLQLPGVFNCPRSSWRIHLPDQKEYGQVQKQMVNNAQTNSKTFLSVNKS